jgi:hypothetical protein
MLTQAENQAAREQAADFVTAAAAYKAFLTSHNLPLSLDTTKLLDIYRGRLFEQLLAADTGLKARYDMARTTEGKRQILVDTMAGISLAGHELPEQLAEAMADLQAAYRTVPQLNSLKYLELGQLLGGYDLDYGRYLDQYTMNWEGMENAVAYFEQLGGALTQWRTVRASIVGSEPNSFRDLLHELDYFFPSTVPEHGPIKVDLKRLYGQLKQNPHLLDMLVGPPARQAA